MVKKVYPRKIKNSFRKALKVKRLKAAKNLGMTLDQYEEKFMKISKSSKVQEVPKVAIVNSSSIESAKKYHEKRAKRIKLSEKAREKKRKKLNLPKPKRNIWTVKK